ncbi:MAG: hypothetical protein Q8K58_11735 [Acidimicrobiales bacterium]|nr:hypothetical protein [Acidimicrobiales bacterium]
MTRTEAQDDQVRVLRWPAEESLRRALAARGRPRMLLVEQGTPPPDVLDPLEDWLRWPPDPDDLRARAACLGRIAAPAPAPALPLLDEDGLLRKGDRWVAISEGQVPVLRLLLEQVDRVVRYEAIAAAYATTGGSGHPSALRTAVNRLHTRIRPLGLELIAVRRRGVVLRQGQP